MLSYCFTALIIINNCLYSLKSQQNLWMIIIQKFWSFYIRYCWNFHFTFSFECFECCLFLAFLASFLTVLLGFLTLFAILLLLLTLLGSNFVFAFGFVSSTSTWPSGSTGLTFLASDGAFFCYLLRFAFFLLFLAWRTFLGFLLTRFLALWS